MIARRSMKAIAAALLASASAVAVSAMPASAHITIVTYGTTFTAGSTNVFYIRVPHGCPDPDLATQGFNARTNRVTVQIPAAATGVKPEQKPGWDVSVTRDGVSKAVTSITWSARTLDDATHDWSFADFGVRASLTGVAGDVLSFDTTQYCDFHEDGTPTTGLSERWTGADVPKLTLVGADKKVANAADLADLKGRVVALETSVTGALSSIASLITADSDLDSRLDAAEAAISSLDANARLGFVSAKSGKWASIVIDLPTVSRWSKATVKVNGTTVQNAFLNNVGDAAVILTKAQSAAIRNGDSVEVWVNSTLAAQGTVG
jgi:uncharacterized protein YcnI